MTTLTPVQMPTIRHRHALRDSTRSDELPARRLPVAGNPMFDLNLQRGDNFARASGEVVEVRAQLLELREKLGPHPGTGMWVCRRPASSRIAGGLDRRYGDGYDPFVTFSCYFRRLGFFETHRPRRL
jgi:hypothetical protein